MAPAAAAGMPFTANTANPFGTAVTANGAMPTITSAAMTGGVNLQAQQQQQLAAVQAAAAAAAQQQQNAAVLSSQFHLAAASGGTKLQTSVSPVTSQPSSQSPAAVSNLSTNSAKLGSPAAKKFRPAYTRPSHKGARYIPKPIPAELGNLKTYSKKLFYSIHLYKIYL